MVIRFVASRFVLPCVAFVFAVCAYATPGGLNKDGCHNSKSLGFHCHATSGHKLPSGSSESKAERSSRLKRECKGKSNSGLCEGYTR
jgi:hypothetical protein